MKRSKWTTNSQIKIQDWQNLANIQILDVRIVKTKRFV